MNIGIDGNEANAINRVGINHYAHQVLVGLYNLQDIKNGSHSITIFLKIPPHKHMPKETKNWKYVVLPGKGVWIIKKLMPYLWSHHHRIDIFWSTSHYVPPLAPMPVVCSIMDLGYLEFSGQFKKYDFWQLKYWSAWSLIVSKTILTISDTTRKDIVRHYPFTSHKVKVTLLGYDKNKYNLNVPEKDVRRVKNKYTIGSKYLLFLGVLKPSKNIEGLIKAWSQIQNNFPDVTLVIAGRKGWLFNPIFELVQKLDLVNRVIFTDFVDEEDKAALIKGSEAFVLPSFWEGFGLDVLSAMACGVPVIVSNTGSLPEVAGEAGLAVNPYDIDDIALALKKVLTMNTLEYAKLQKKGVLQAQGFSWEKAAKQTLEFIVNTKK